MPFEKSIGWDSRVKPKGRDDPAQRFEILTLKQNVKVLGGAWCPMNGQATPPHMA